MADKAISELVAAERILAGDLFVLEQDGTAKKLQGQVLLNWLTAAAGGHGGIQDITGPVIDRQRKTFTIILADNTEYTFTVEDGNGVTDFKKISTVDLVDTYRMSFLDGTHFDIPVKNGAKGDKGDNAYVHIKYASQDPSIPPHSFGDIPDNWRGEYTDSNPEASENWEDYNWFETKGEKGNTGDPAEMDDTKSSVSYQISDRGTIIPDAWQNTIPDVPPGKYLWTRTIFQFNTGSPITMYTASRQGVDGTGAVSSVNSHGPDGNGNVELDAEDVSALPLSGGTMQGSIDMNGQNLGGLNAPTQSDQAANKGYVDNKVGDIPDGQTVKGYVDGQKLIFTDITVPTGYFSNLTDTELNAQGFMYKGLVLLDGVTASMFPMVTFNPEDSGSGVFASVADTYDGGVYLYSKEVPSASITIPSIILWKGGN